MNEEICNKNDDKTTKEILQYISSTSYDISGAPMQDLNDLLKSINCMLPSEDNIGEESYIVPEKDYEPLQEIFGMMYDTFAENSTITKEQFVEEMFTIAMSMQKGKEPPEIKVEELLGGAKTPPPKVVPDTKVNKEEQENEDKQENGVLGTITAKQVLSSGLILCLVHLNYGLPKYAMVLSPFTFEILCGAKTIIINQTLNILFSEKVKSILE